MAQGGKTGDASKKTKGGKATKRTNLASERTKLANERTFMAFGRTAFSMIVVGLSILEFFDQERYQWLGISLIPLGILVGIVGLIRYIKKRKLISNHSLESYNDKYE